MGMMTFSLQRQREEEAKKKAELKAAETKETKDAGKEPVSDNKVADKEVKADAKAEKNKDAPKADAKSDAKTDKSDAKTEKSDKPKAGRD